MNITDITDESGYIDSIGKKAAAEAINQAKIDVAVQDKLGSTGHAEATRERDVRVAENVASAEKGKKKAEALQKGEVARLDAQVEIQKAQYRAEQERLTAEEVVVSEIDKRKIEIAAEAEAEKVRREAKGTADAILMKYEAEAKGIRQVLESKAQGYQGLIKSCNGDARAAATLLMTEKIEEIVKLQTEAIKNIKIDKITVWDAGKDGSGGTATSNFMSGLIRSLPPLHEVAKMAGVELPQYLGNIAEEKGKGAGKENA